MHARRSVLMAFLSGVPRVAALHFSSTISFSVTTFSSSTCNWSVVMEVYLANSRLSASAGFSESSTGIMIWVLWSVYLEKMCQWEERLMRKAHQTLSNGFDRL